MGDNPLGDNGGEALLDLVRELRGTVASLLGRVARLEEEIVLVSATSSTLETTSPIDRSVVEIARGQIDRAGPSPADVPEETGVGAGTSSPVTELSLSSGWRLLRFRLHLVSVEEAQTELTAEEVFCLGEAHRVAFGLLNKDIESDPDAPLSFSFYMVWAEAFFRDATVSRTAKTPPLFLSRLPSYIDVAPPDDPRCCWTARKAEQEWRRMSSDESSGPGDSIE